MIKLVGFYPPSCSFHKQLWIIIFICEERVKRNANSLTLGKYLLCTNADDFIS